MSQTEILSFPNRGPRPADPRFHRILMYLFTAVVLCLLANIVVLVVVARTLSELRAERAESSEHQRLTVEMRKREMHNAALILVEQERRLRKLRE